MMITNVVARWPGSTYIFTESRLNDTFVSRQVQGLLIDDAGHDACLPYLMTSKAHENEEHYNKAHILTRNVIERVFAWFNFGLSLK